MIERLFYLSFIAALLLALSCNKTSDFASFLDEEGKIDVDFLEIPIKGNSIAVDSLTTYNDSVFFLSHFSGQMQDPLFGTTDARFYLQFGISSSPDFSDGSLDSVVLSLAYDTLERSYGLYEQMQDLGVYRVVEDMVSSENYYSTTTFEIEDSPLGTVQHFVPNFDSSVFVIEPSLIRDTVDTNEYGPHLRIQLSDDFGNELMGYDETTYASNTEFLGRVKGLSLASEDGIGGITYFDLRSPVSRINLYYTQRDTARIFIYTVSSLSVITSRFENDLSGSLADQFVDDLSDNDSLLFVQSMNGPDAQISIPDLHIFDGRSINLATIEFFVAVLPEDDTAHYKPIEQMALFENSAGNEIILVKDALDFRGSADFDLLFGGALEMDEDTGLQRYRMNITQHLQRIINGESDNTMILTNLNRETEAARVVLYGPGHSQHKPKLKVTFTEF
ncbi:MAG: DUF4270 domain-containing protein [Saprospiraceae bacterium]|nr:DUF4270 domain-containing protein [Saprospiraceae bacterium]